MREPLPIGTIYDGQRIVDVLQVDEGDADYQPYQYELANGAQVWIPLDKYDALLAKPDVQGGE